MLKKIITTILFAAVLLCIVPCASAKEADSDSVISQDSDFVPLYTTAPDSSLRNPPNYMSTDQGIFFYTQTTMLALIAGYLIIFKVRCIPKGEKMHRRKKKNQ